MSLAEREEGVATGEPVELYLLQGAEPSLETSLRAITLEPGTGEFAMGTTAVRETNGNPLNEWAGQSVTDFLVSLDQLQSTVPNLTAVNLLVSQFGNDIRAGSCLIAPKVESLTRATTPYEWRVGARVRSQAGIISVSDGHRAFGGTPADRSVYEAIVALKQRGLQVTVTPIILLDIPSGNAKPDPYGAAEQQAYPHRSRITCYPAPGRPGTVDKTTAAATQVNAFFGTATAAQFGWNATGRYVTYTGPDEWSYRRFVLHVAAIAKAAGGVSAMMVGSDLRGITRVRSSSNSFPGVIALRALAAQVRTLMGSGVAISYAADWTEYHSYRPADGSNDVFFNLDTLWVDGNINFVGINQFAPLADWRDGTTHLDRAAGYTSIYETDYLRSNIEGGEAYDWRYADTGARSAQTRTPIADPAYGDPWVYRDKDLRNWWLSIHRNRPGGVRLSTNTGWTAGMKPVVFMEFGCSAIDKGPNLPDAVYNPPLNGPVQSFPYFSAATSDDTAQRVLADTLLAYWPAKTPISPTANTPMITASSMFARAWDVRPSPTFPDRDQWRDRDNYWRGRWLNGRMWAGDLANAGTFGPYGFTNAEQPIERNGIVYIPAAVTREALSASGTLDKSALNISIARGFDPDFDLEFLSAPPSCIVNLTIFLGHAGETPDDPLAFGAIWSGRVLGAAKAEDTMVTQLTCEPISVTLKRVGLRQNYQRGCPHALYGPKCRADRAAATYTATVAAISTTGIIRMTSALPGPHAPAKFAGGLVTWMDGATPVARSISRVVDSDEIQVRGLLGGLVVGQSVTLSLGCAHNTSDCRTLHSNILNYGGQPYIPMQNPLGPRNQFF